MRISIVFEETGPRDAAGNQPFVVYMDGHDSVRMKLPDEYLSAAEYWARQMFAFVRHTMGQAGAVVSVQEPKGAKS